jgi:hypothetical protein
MVTGDHTAAVQTIGAALDLDSVLADRVPSDKVDAVRAEQRLHPTVMVGDGINDAPALAPTWASRSLTGPRFGNYQMEFRFGQVGYELVERRGLKRFQASTYLCFSVFVLRWMTHVRACRELVHPCVGGFVTKIRPVRTASAVL